MRAQHGEVLDLEGPAAVLQKVVDLAVIVEEEGALLRNLLTRKVMRLQLDVGGEARDVGLDADGGFGGGERVLERVGDAEPRRACTRYSGGLEHRGVGGVGGGIKAVCYRVIWVHDVVDVVDGDAAVCVLVARYAWGAVVVVVSAGLASVASRQQSGLLK